MSNNYIETIKNDIREIMQVELKKCPTGTRRLLLRNVKSEEEAKWLKESMSPKDFAELKVWQNVFFQGIIKAVSQKYNLGIIDRKYINETGTMEEFLESLVNYCKNHSKSYQINASPSTPLTYEEKMKKNLEGIFSSVKKQRNSSKELQKNLLKDINSQIKRNQTLQKETQKAMDRMERTIPKMTAAIESLYPHQVMQPNQPHRNMTDEEFLMKAKNIQLAIDIERAKMELEEEKRRGR